MRPTIKPYLWKIILIFIRNFDIFFEFLTSASAPFLGADADVRCITSHKSVSTQIKYSADFVHLQHLISYIYLGTLWLVRPFILIL